MTETVAIIIFGAAVRPDGSPSPTLRRRVEGAFALGRHSGSVLYVPTGAVGRFGPSEARVMATILSGLGVPQSAILLEETGTNTLTSVEACARHLRDHSGPIYAASSAYHLPRCLTLLHLAGCKARACPAPPTPGFYHRWFMRLREVAALPIDIILVSLHRFSRSRSKGLPGR